MCKQHTYNKTEQNNLIMCYEINSGKCWDFQDFQNRSSRKLDPVGRSPPSQFSVLLNIREYNCVLPLHTCLIHSLRAASPHFSSSFCPSPHALELSNCQEKQGLVDIMDRAVYFHDVYTGRIASSLRKEISNWSHGMDVVRNLYNSCVALIENTAFYYLQLPIYQ